MCRKIWLSSVVLLLIFCGGVVNVSANENVVARVGGEPVTSFDLQREMNKIMPMLVSFHGKVTKEKQLEIQQKAYGNLIERGYKTCSAIKNKMLVAESDITAVIDKARNQLSQEEFERAVATETLAGLRASVGRQLLAEAAEKKFVDTKISVTDDDVSAFYEKHKETYQRPRQFKASHILIKVDPALTKEDKRILRERAEDLLEKAKTTEDFFNLAYFNSDDRTKYVGGDLGLFHEGQTVPEFEAALQSMKVGEISEIVTTMYGFHIIKLTEKNEPRQLLFDEVSDKIRKLLEDRQREELYAAWMTALQVDCPVEKSPF